MRFCACLQECLKMDVSCPQCGNPNLDVDAQNNVVYCKKCGFAVRVDPQTGNVTPISDGGQTQAPQESFAGESRSPSVMGMDPLTFFLLFSAVVMLMMFGGLPLEYAFVGEIILFLIYWYKH